MKAEPEIKLTNDNEEWGTLVSDLSAYHLTDDQSRREFLFTFYWIGEEALFAAVAHVWERLAEPREWRCSQMGLASGAGGKGKTALMLVLQKFLTEALDCIEPLPEREDFASSEEWHLAVKQSFASDEAAVVMLCRRYASVLNGDAPRRCPGTSPVDQSH